jgi:hypothetical protein
MKKKLDKKVLTIKYNVEIQEIDKRTREIKKSDIYHNLVVNVGLQHVANLLGGLGGASNFSYIALGTDNTSPSAGDTGLYAEVERELATISSPGSNQVRFEKVFSVGSGVSHNIRELCVSDSASETGEVILSRSNVVNTLDADTDLSVKVTYTIS